MKLLTVSPAPHIRDKASTRSIMLDVLIALAPTLVASIVIFGFQALLVTGVCVGMAVLSEFVFEKGVKKSVTINDLSAVVTGVITGLAGRQIVRVLRLPGAPDPLSSKTKDPGEDT